MKKIVAISMKIDLLHKLNKLVTIKSKFIHTTKSDIINELVEEYLNSKKS